ncbi:hypothetical protein OAB94_00965 [Flavobacteriaceae bacterium]|nr:hypothetical protein [Flavobacteriaceae bacterium]
MAISPQLQQFKSSGVYRLEFDKSQTVNIPAETIRLVVGYSKKGPYNTPVFIEDTEQFTQVFGGVDKSLEKKGMFFHRSALETLSRGPILALNLTSADVLDTVSMVSPVTDGGEQGLSYNDLTVAYSDVFDTDKFWTPSDSKLLTAASNTASNSSKAITFSNIKQDPITIIVKQAANTAGFEVTAREWYGEGNVPEGITDLEYVSDYMVDVLIFKGTFNANDLNNDPVYGQYFDSKGLIKSQLGTFTNLREVSLIAQYSGSLIPEFMDNEGRQLYIETLVNSEARRTGLFCAVNEDALGSIDLIGEGFDIYQDYQLLSHNIEQTVDATSVALAKVVEVNENVLTIQGITVATLPAGLEKGKFLLSTIAGEYSQIISRVDSGTGDVLITVDTLRDINKTGGTYESFVTGTAPDFTPTGTVTVNAGGDLVITGFTTFTANDLNITNSFLLSANAGEYAKVTNIDTSVAGQVTISSSEGFASSYDGEIGLNPIDVYMRGASSSIVTYEININERVKEVPTGWTFTAEGVGKATWHKTQASSLAAPVFSPDIKVGMYMPDSVSGKLARILQIQKLPNTVDTSGVTSMTTYKYRFVTHRNLTTEPLYALKRYEDATSTYTMFPIAGSVVNEKPISALLTMLKPGNGLSNTLIDKDAISFRYVVDTFASLENGGILNKEEITQLCKERQNASAILNAPMVHELKASTNPSFKNEITGAFETRYIATGGNIALNPTALYTLPSLNEGANFGFYYGPGLNVIENGRTKVIPPAAYVSNNYIDKYSDALPWSIIAGPRRGVVGGTGVQSLEYSFDKNDRDVLEPFGINPIVFERGVGLTIKGNKTAQQSIQSALSSAHVREAMIYIEDGLAEILKNYLFEFNSAQTRLEIKTLADNFMESVKKDGGVFDYRNIMDGTNNTNDVIDNNMGILDTYVEPVKGLEILVSRVTILNTGEIATGNFA